MGHANSKKKRDKILCQTKTPVNNMTAVTGRQTGVRQTKPLTCSEFDKIDQESLPFSSVQQITCSNNNIKLNTLPIHRNNNSKDYQIETSKWSTLPISHGRSFEKVGLSDKKGSFSYEKLNVDDHPALTKLQNEQNRRLEKMEARMSEIRLHAMQEVERRKYAHLFKAKEKESPTRELLCKAKDKLSKEICDKQKTTEISVVKSNSPHSSEDIDKGEIIPVIVSESGGQPKDDNEKVIPVKNNYLQNLPALRTVNINDPKSIVFFPVLLVIFIFLMVVRSVSRSDMWNSANNTRQKKKN